MTKIKRMNVVSPDFYAKLMEDHKCLNSIRKNPVTSYVLRMETIIPHILQSKDLTSHEKIRRYTGIMNKLNSLTASHYKVEGFEAPLDENPAANYKPIEVASVEVPILNETAILNETPILNEELGEFSPIKAVESTPIDSKTLTNEETTLLEEFSLRNQKKAATIIKAIESTPGIAIDPKTLTMSVDGKKVGSGNLLDFTHVLLTPMQNSPPSEGMKTILSKLATDSQLSSHALINPTLRSFMNQQRNSDDPPPIQHWIHSPKLTSTPKLKCTVRKLRSRPIYSP